MRDYWLLCICRSRNFLISFSTFRELIKHFKLEMDFFFIFRQCFIDFNGHIELISQVYKLLIGFLISSHKQLNIVDKILMIFFLWENKNNALSEISLVDLLGQKNNLFIYKLFFKLNFYMRIYFHNIITHVFQKISF